MLIYNLYSPGIYIAADSLWYISIHNSSFRWTFLIFKFWSIVWKSTASPNIWGTAFSLNWITNVNFVYTFLLGKKINGSMRVTGPMKLNDKKNVVSIKLLLKFNANCRIGFEPGTNYVWKKKNVPVAIPQTFCYFFV